jgi:putative acetyltransferase
VEQENQARVTRVSESGHHRRPPVSADSPAALKIGAHPNPEAIAATADGACTRIAQLPLDPMMTRLDIALRIAASPDIAQLRALYAAAVRGLAPEHYSPEQIAVWSGYAQAPAFRQFILHPLTVLATHDDEPIGFCGVEPTGHIASLYVHPAHVRRGIGSLLLRAALDRCPSPSDGHWSAEASLLSRPVFARFGFKQVAVEHSVRDGVAFERYRMRRDQEQNKHSCTDHA